MQELNRGGVQAVGGSTDRVSDAFTRPADVNAYAANDRVSATTSDTGTTPLRGLQVGRIPAGTGWITGIRLWTNNVTAMTPNIRVHFFTVAAPATALAGDNAQVAVVYANREQRFAVHDLDNLATPAGTGSDVSIIQDLTVRIPFECAAEDKKIYYALETLDAFTPASGQAFFLEVAVEHN